MGRWVRLCILVFAALWGGAARAALQAEEVELKVTVESDGPAMLERLADWVGTNTGSYDRAGLRDFAAELIAPFQELGFETELRDGVDLDTPGHPGFRTGPMVVARRPSPTGTGPQILLGGHYDTVFEASSPFQKFELAGDSSGRATGPGVADMKGGLVILIEALRALRETGDLDRASWTVLLNADEELGSLGSRTAIEAEARRSDFGLVFEASYGGAMVASRRGLGQFHLAVKGVGAHAGNAHERGRSAIYELAHKVLAIQALTDYERGITLNVGTISGGSKRNIIPDHAEAWIDVRYDDVASGREIQRRLQEISDRVFVPGTHSQLWGTLHRPPKLETPEVDALLDRHAAVAVDLGLPVPARVHSGGGTDGSLMGAVGLPTLDSLGVIGGNAHTEREFIEIGSLTSRAALAAILMRRLIRDPPQWHPAEGGGRSRRGVPGVGTGAALRLGSDSIAGSPAGGAFVNPVRSGRKQR